MSALVIGGLMGLAGRFTDAWLWAYAATSLGTSLYGMLSIDDDLARERFSPPESGADQWWLLTVQLVALGHLVVAGIDNRLGATTSVSAGLRGLALAGMAAGFFLVFRAMRENHFFSAVVRIPALIVRRVAFEDRFLRESLDGYRACSARVAYRLMPGIW